MTHPLLQPRYEVIGDYPGNIFKVTDVLTKNPYAQSCYGNLNGVICHPENYPNLFRHMAWWEQRGKEDMPKFLSYKLFSNETPRVFKVATHFYGINGARPDGFIDEYGDFRYYSRTIPATESEYNEYLKTKQL